MSYAEVCVMVANYEDEQTQPLAYKYTQMMWRYALADHDEEEHYRRDKYAKYECCNCQNKFISWKTMHIPLGIQEAND